MNRLQRDAVLVSLVDAMGRKGSWCGETHIQKCTYFLQDLLRAPLGFDFILYKHGPYSFDLASALGQMYADQLLTRVPRGKYGPSIEPGSNHELLLRLYPKTLSSYDPAVRFVAEHVADRNVAELERLGTAMYVSLQPGGEEDVEARAQKLHRLKPHVSVDEAREAVGEFDKLRERWERSGAMRSCSAPD